MVAKISRGLIEETIRPEGNLEKRVDDGVRKYYYNTEIYELRSINSRATNNDSY